MPLGGDLGFSFLVLLLVVVFSPLVAFLVRRKWRLAVARREEIKRLLVLASEEAARAELEAVTGYLSSEGVSTSRQFHYQCVVCFCPTTTRCAQCKAVRYCSSKCQIIHWRQGHKEECRPFATIQQINNDIGGSVQEVSQEEEREICGDSFELERKQSANPAEKVPVEPAFSNSIRSLETLCEKTECLADGKGADSNFKVATSSSPKEFSARTTFSGSTTDVATDKVSHLHNSETLDVSTDTVPNKIETTCANMDRTVRTSSEHSTLVNSADGFMSSGRLNQIKLDGSDVDSHFVSTSSSGSAVDGSKSSFSETFTPFSGFWEGIVDSNQSKNDVPDDSVSDPGDGNLSELPSSLNFSLNLARDVTPSLPVQDSDAKAVISDGARGIAEPVDGAALSEVSENILKVRSTPSLNSKMSNHVDNKAGSDSRELNSGVSQVHPASTSGKHSDPSNACSLKPLSSKRSNYMVNGMDDTLHILKSNEAGSLSTAASDAHLSSSSRRHSVSSAKTCKVDDVHSAKSGKVDNADTVVANSTSFTSCSLNAGNGLRTSMRKVVDQFRFSKSSQHYAPRQVGVECDIVGRYNNKGLFPYEMFVNLYHWNKVELHPCGLKNCGNSCYANAVLQCLSFTPPLTAYFLQGLHSKSCENKGWCFTCEFESLIVKAKEANSPLSPMGILSQLQNIGSRLGNGREEDAHEFLRYAIDAMQSNCLTDAGVKASGSLGEESTLIGLTFGGYLRSKVKCMKCGGKSERHETMMDLTVEIEGEIGTLEEALRKFTGTEILDGENKYKCTRCKSYEKAKKKLTVSDAPNVLTIVLKRFQSGKFGKLNKAIRFPDILNLAPYMSGTSDKSPIYKLYGVVVHLDINNASFSGHYVCYVKNIQNKWFKVDDSMVKPVELERVLTKGAYMLLYARCSPRAPRLIRNALVPSDPRKLKNLTFKTRSHPPGQSDACVADSLNLQAFTESFYPRHSSYQLKQPNFEEDSLSDTSSAFSLSHEGSSSTESTRGSTGTEDFIDQIFGDLGRDWNSLWRNCSDSETSSSSTSSPLYSSHSTLTDFDCSSGGPKTSGSHSHNTESIVEGYGLRARLSRRNGKLENVEGKGSIPLLHSDTRSSRKLASSTCSRETDSERLGWANRGIISGVSTGGSMRERTE